MLHLSNTFARNAVGIYSSAFLGQPDNFPISRADMRAVAGLCNSLLLGGAGNFTISGINVLFGEVSLSNRILLCISQARVPVFVHLMSQALVNQLFTGQGGQQIILPTFQNIRNHMICNPTPLAPWQDSIMSAAGTMGTLAFAMWGLIAVRELHNYIPQPVTTLLRSSSGIGMMEAYSSIAAGDAGDFGRIRANGTIHLVVAGSCVATQAAFVMRLALADHRAQYGTWPF